MAPGPAAGPAAGIGPNHNPAWRPARRLKCQWWLSAATISLHRGNQPPRARPAAGVWTGRQAQNQRTAHSCSELLRLIICRWCVIAVCPPGDPNPTPNLISLTTRTPALPTPNSMPNSTHMLRWDPHAIFLLLKSIAIAYRWDLIFLDGRRH